MDIIRPFHKLPFLLFIAALSLLAFVANTQACADSKIVRVIDGDTLVVMCNGVEQKILLHGVDCPELGQPFGEQAKKFTSDKVRHSLIGVMELNKDQYGRVIAEVILADRKKLNHELLKHGLAWWYRRYAFKDATLRKLEKEAMAAKKGLWSQDEPVPPWEWRNMN